MPRRLIPLATSTALLALALIGCSIDRSRANGQSTSEVVDFAGARQSGSPCVQTAELSACAEVAAETTFAAGGPIVYRLKLRTFATAEKFRITESPPLFSRDDGPMFMSPGIPVGEGGPAVAPIATTGNIKISPHTSTGYTTKPCTISTPRRTHGDTTRWKTTFTAAMPATSSATITISHPTAPNANPWPTAGYRSTFDFSAIPGGADETLSQPVRTTSDSASVNGATGARVTLRQTSPGTGTTPQSARYIKGRAVMVRGQVEAGPEYKTVHLTYWGRRSDLSVIAGPIASYGLDEDGLFAFKWTRVPRGLAYAEIRATAASESGKSEYARCGRTFRTIK